MKKLSNTEAELKKNVAYRKKRVLSLRLTQKDLQVAVFYLSLSRLCFWTDRQKLLVYFFSVSALVACVTNIGLINMICCVLSSHVLYIEINSNGGFKQEHVKSCSSTTKIIISALLQCL